MNIVTEFLMPVRVYYEDTDSGGVVYYANYLRFLERARTEWLRSQGIEQDQLRAQFGVLFAVRSLTIDYHRPARFNDLLEVSVRVVRLGKASMEFEQSITCQVDQQQLASARVKVACLDAVLFKPKPIPDEMWKEIQA